MVSGNDGPGSKCMDLLTDGQYGPDVGAHPFVLRIPECRHKWCEGLKSSMCSCTIDTGLVYMQGDMTAA